MARLVAGLAAGLLGTLTCWSGVAAASPGEGTSAPTATTADRPLGTYVIVEPNPITPRIGPGPNHRVLYMNRNGATVTSGWDDSSSNVSSVPNSTSTVSAWSYGDAAWTELMACVRVQYAPFDIEVTDVDPGATEHIESLVGGTPQQIGMPNGVGGVSPVNGDCSVVERAIVYTFSAVYGGDVQSICETVAQESGHALGMDHEMKCEDPMTYLYGCGSKSFQDIAVPCGENSNRTCMCGNATQNSVQHLLAVLGPADSIGPTVNITQPANGATVAAGFPVAATASDNVAVTKVDLLVDGVLVASDASSPYTFTAPAALAAGVHGVQVVAYDGQGHQTPSSINVTVGGGNPSGCVSNADCGVGYACDMGTGDCRPVNPQNPGGLGDPCTANEDCSSSMCGSDGSNQYCTEACIAGADPCPTGFSCQGAQGGGGVCWPTGNPADPGDPGAPDLITGGCTVGGHGSAVAGLTSLLLALGTMLVVRRRR